MRCHDAPSHDARTSDTAIHIEALLQPAFLASFSPSGALAAFRTNALHVQAFGTKAGDMRRLWLEKAGSALLAGGACLEYEEQHPALPSGSHWWRFSLLPLRPSGESGARDVLGLCIDVTCAKSALSDLESAAYEDGLTALGNRRAFDRDLAAAVVGSKPFALLVCDVDRFKPINDRYGHAAGDDVLRRVAIRLKQGLRRDDRVYRIGGDEFAALIFAGGESAPAAVARRLGDGFRALACPDGKPISVSIGGTRWRPGASSKDLYAMADAAMYAAKHRPNLQGRNE